MAEDEASTAFGSMRIVQMMFQELRLASLAAAYTLRNQSVGLQDLHLHRVSAWQPAMSSAMLPWTETLHFLEV